jgi:hypothetical protein
MRIALWIAVAAVLGAAFGFGAALVRVRPWGGPAAGWEDAAARPEQMLPRVAVDAAEHDFGTMDIEAEGEHVFVFRNVGEAILRLKPRGGTCGCAVGEVEPAEVPPGGESRVTVRWHPDGRVGPYEETVRVETSDPTQPIVELKVKGAVTVAVRADPWRLVFSQVTAGEPATASTHLWSYVEEPLEILGWEPDQSATAEFFDVEWTPVEPEEVERLEAEPDAEPRDEPRGNESPGPAAGDETRQTDMPPPRSGYRIDVTVKPGLPQGRFRQTIRLQTNLEAAPNVEIPVEGMVTGEIAVVGRDWDGDSGVLDIGVVAAEQGASRRLLLIARGPGHEQVEFRIAEVVPKLLRVELRGDERTTLSHGRVTQTPLFIQVPQGSPPVDHLGSESARLGRITIETTHPRVPSIVLYVRLAIEGDVVIQPAAKPKERFTGGA